MDVSAIAAQSGGNNRTAARDSEALASDFDTFLQLLTAQIRNQDPLNPADSTEYATQLATFSNVEQGVRTNTLLENLITQFQAQGLDQVASWIGMDVRTTGATAYDGGEVTLELTPSPFASAADLVITDLEGIEMGRMPVDPSAAQTTLVPRGFDGLPLPQGSYSFHVEPVGSSGPMSPQQAGRYVTVREALVENGAAVLVLDGGARINSAEITGIRPAA